MRGGWRQGAQTDLSPDSSDWAANRFTACPFNSLSAYNGGWHGAAGGRLFRLCPGKVRARISAGKRQGGPGRPRGLPAPFPPPSPSRTGSRTCAEETMRPLVKRTEPSEGGTP